MKPDLKDREAFERGGVVCYMPYNHEWETSEYRRGDIVDVCFGNQDLAGLVFDLLHGQHPSTVIEDILRRDIAEAPEMYGLDEPPKNREEAVEALKNFTSDGNRKIDFPSLYRQLENIREHKFLTDYQQSIVNEAHCVVQDLEKMLSDNGLDWHDFSRGYSDE